MRQWIAHQMELLLGFSDAGLISAIENQKSESELRKYCGELLGDQKSFVDELVKRKFGNSASQNNNQGRNASSGNSRGGKKNKKNSRNNILLQETALPGQNGRNSPSQNNSRAPVAAPKAPQVQSAAQLASSLFGTTFSNAPPVIDKRTGQGKTRRKTRPKNPEPEPEPITESKKAAENLPKEDDSFQMPEVYKPKPRPKKDKRKKFKTLDEADEGGFLMPGRQKCDCQAQKHDLINNCLACGRIVCEQEGEGPCLFCGEMVLYPDVAYISDENLKKALARKDMLLDFDRNSSKRTEVVDDETDYYRGVDEELVREARHGSRLKKKFCLDLASGDMVEQTLDEFIDEHAVDEVVVEKRNNKELLLFNEDLGNNNLTYNFKKKGTVSKTEKKAKRSRIQDARLTEMSDTGTCLTMHQPWASLLIKGIKIHEGRVWPTNHRERLWIHSSSRHADQETLDDVLKDHPEGKDLDWRISSLLGFVTVDDCLNQEDYRAQFPDGKSQADYVFICSDPIELDIKLQMSGNHKDKANRVAKQEQKIPNQNRNQLQNRRKLPRTCRKKMTLFQMSEVYKPKPRAKKDKRKKFKTLDEADKGRFLMPGRQKCDCQAQKHDLINNCLACGRIACEQEGEGPCLLCGQMVLYPDVAYISDENFKKALARKDERKSTKLILQNWSSEDESLIVSVTSGKSDKGVTRAITKNELEKYAYGLKNKSGNEEDLGSKLSDEDKEDINTVDEIFLF